jgi:large subunit ribosomal protein L10
MSKPVKEMIIDEYKSRFHELEGALVVDVRGIPANENNEFRLGLQKESIRVTVIKNTLARKAFDGTALESLGPVLEGPSALVYGAESVVDVARSLVDWAKKIKELDLKGAVLDGELFAGDEGVKRLSAFPTKVEAQARVVQLILSPAGNVVGCATSPGSKILSVVKEIQERLEDGKSIEKIA